MSNESKVAASAVKKKTTKKTKKEVKRRFNKDHKIMHDLYKLEVAKAIKNVAWAPGQVQLAEVEHVHFFHSVDKNGAPQDKCVPISKHFHIMEKVPGSDLEYRCSGPKKFVLNKMPNGQMKKVIVDVPNDEHTHEVSYIRSDEFKRQKINAEAAKFIQEQTKVPDPVPGIIG